MCVVNKSYTYSKLESHIYNALHGSGSNNGLERGAYLLVVRRVCGAYFWILWSEGSCEIFVNRLKRSRFQTPQPDITRGRRDKGWGQRYVEPRKANPVF